MAISKDEKQKIINSIQQKLHEKRRSLMCPVCGNNGFILAEGYTQDTLQDQLNGLVIGGPSVPVIIVVCSHCGNVIRFSLGILGLLPKQEVKEEVKNAK